MDKDLHATLGFVCDYCGGLEFKYDSDYLIDHQKSPDWDNKPNYCLRCGKEYESSSIISMCMMARLPNGRKVNPKDINPKFKLMNAHERHEHMKALGD